MRRQNGSVPARLLWLSWTSSSPQSRQPLQPAGGKDRCPDHLKAASQRKGGQHTLSDVQTSSDQQWEGAKDGIEATERGRAGKG